MGLSESNFLALKTKFHTIIHSLTVFQHVQTTCSTKPPEDTPGSNNYIVLSSRVPLQWFKLNDHKVPMPTPYVILSKTFPPGKFICSKKAQMAGLSKSVQVVAAHCATQRQMPPSKSDGLCLVSMLPNFARQFFSC